MAPFDDDDPRPRTEARKLLAKQVREAYEQDPTLKQAVMEARLERPKHRSDCEDGPRPCPWLSCRYHLAVEITSAGGLKDVFPGRELEEMPATCSLDLADQGPRTLEAVAVALNVVRERVRQVEARLLEKMRKDLAE